MATAAVRLSQVVGALEYKGEAERLQETQRALKHSLEQLATAPLAQQEPALVERIILRSRELQSSVEGMLQRGQRRHLERNALLSSLYQNQSYLRHLQKLTGAQDDVLLGQIDRLIVAAIETPTPRSVVKQLDGVMPALPVQNSNPLITNILIDFNQSCISWSRFLLRLSRAIWRSTGICFISKRWWRSSTAISTGMLRRWR